MEEPMNVRASLAGFGTGVLLIGLMYYPLYVVLPGKYIPEWGRGSSQLAVELEVAAGIIVVIGGLLAAMFGGNHSRLKGMEHGAWAGFLAGMLLFIELGGAAAGTAGHSIIFEHGFRPAADLSQFSFLMAHPIVKTICLTYKIFWMMILVGIVLGGLGGLLAPRRIEKRPQPQYCLQVRVGLSLAATIAAALHCAGVLSCLPSIAIATQDVIRRNGLTNKSLEPMSIFYYSAITALIIYLAALSWLTWTVWRTGRSEASKELFTASGAGYIGGVIALGNGLLMFFINRDYALKRHFFIGVLISLIVGVMLIVFGKILSRKGRRISLQQERRKLWPIVFIFAYPVLLIAAFFIAPNHAKMPPCAVLISAMIAGLIYLGLLYWISKCMRKRGVPISSTLHPEFWQQNWMELSLGATLAILMPFFSGLIQLILSLALGLVRMISVLGPSSHEAAYFTPASLVRDLYTEHGRDN
jgi:hypothetical protein